MANQDFRQEAADLTELAALYVLDVLEPEEKLQAEAYLANSPEFAQQVEEYSATFTAFAYSAPPQPMAKDLKNRLWQRLGEENPHSVSELYQLMDISVEELKETSASLKWEPVPSTVSSMMAIWRVDESTRDMAFFVKATSKDIFPKHSHAQGEEILVLAGEIVIEGKIYGEGDRIYSDGGTSHQPETFNGCLLFCISSVDDEIFV